MSVVGGDVDISYAGIVSVDPDGLRTIASRVRHDAVAADLASEDLSAIPAIAQTTGGIGEVSGIATVMNRLETVSAALDRLAGATDTTADVFELAELRAQQRMLAADDTAGLQECRRRIRELLAGNQHLLDAERRLIGGWRAAGVEGFSGPVGAEGPVAFSGMLGLAGLLTGTLSILDLNRTQWAWMGQLVLQGVGDRKGVTPPGPLTTTAGHAIVVDPARASGTGGIEPRPGDVLVTRTRAQNPPGSAPATLGAAVSRLPVAQAPQVRVEKYTLADGSPRFIAYVDGTRSYSVDGRDPDPWDMASNSRAYLDQEESDAYKATVAALRDAGADAATPVDLVGYSQGGMITDRIAQSGEFAVRGVFTVGSPIEPVLTSDVLSVAVRHTDDPVAGLTGGGDPYGSGSTESLVIRRAVAPGHGVDTALPAHQFSAYEETVRRAEQSGDPRMASIADHFAAYAGATLDDVSEYSASRVLQEPR